ncbi:MAG: MBL fold metallo-hydrolase [Chloroflexi bacterium]|nr:MBL fold metallo-hydrolase [Chloroflexota bacterium]
MPTPKITVGNVEIHALLDIRLQLPPSMMFPDVPAESWQEYRDLYPNAYNADGLIVSNAVGYLIRTAGRTILLDLGAGEGPHENFGGVRGSLLEQLAGAGSAPQDVDTVILTHLHWDHTGWAMSGPAGGVAPTFPRAKVLVSEADWSFFSGGDNPHAAAVQAKLAPLHAAGGVELVSGEYAVTDELTIIPTPGHTPGHCSLLVSSQGEGCFLTGDVMHTPAQVTETDWSPASDHDQDQSAESRWTVVQRADVQGLILAAGHFPYPGFGRIARFNGRRGFQALTLGE